MAIDNKTAHSADNYDLEINNTIPYYDKIHQETMELVSAACSPKIWLDTGCGSGTLVRKALDKFPLCGFYLVDPSEAMLKAAHAKFETKSFARLNILKPAGSAELKWNKNTQPDVITAIQAHHYLDRAGREKAVKRLFDLLSAGGLFINFENIRPLSEEGAEIGLKRWKEFQKSCGKSEEAVANQLARFDREYFPITALEHIELLKNTGFRTVEIFWYSVMQAGFYGIK
jgi:tRNA (cmo5U34)-methyltransferase